jgi:predicted amidophosphoribosyltransferase
VIRSAFAYRGALRDLILRWKFSPDRLAGAFLAPLLIEGIVRWYPCYRPDLVIPVPPTLAALRERRFCPALDLALAAARFLGIPCLRDTFSHQGTPQVGRGKKERERGMRGAITPRGPLPGRRLRILVVDDVVTTGATIREMVRAIRLSTRDPEIRSITLARTLSPPSLDLG